MTHIIEVKPYPEDYNSDYDLPEWDVECLVEKKPGAYCNTWWECDQCRKATDEAHERNDVAYIDDLEDRAYEGQIIHGERHGLIGGMVCTESLSCLLYQLDTDRIDEYLNYKEFAPGKYFIEFECEEGSIDYVSIFAKLEENND